MNPEPVAGRPPSDPLAGELRGFGPLGILAILIILAGNLLFQPLSALLVLAWVRLSHTPWSEIGYVRPRSWIRTAAIGIAFGVAFKLVMKTIVMPLLGAPTTNTAYHYLVGNSAALPATVYTMIVIAGFGEETVYRGYMFERLKKLLGTGRGAAIFIVIFTAGLFGAGHYHVQGLAGAEQALITGLVFGTIFAITGRIWILMFAHAAFDLTAFAIIYLNLEPQFAHLVFK